MEITSAHHDLLSTNLKNTLGAVGSASARHFFRSFHCEYTGCNLELGAPMHFYYTHTSIFSWRFGTFSTYIVGIALISKGYKWDLLQYVTKIPKLEF